MARTLDEMLATENPEVVAKARAKADAMLLNIHLGELRERVQKTQCFIELKPTNTVRWNIAVSLDLDQFVCMFIAVQHRFRAASARSACTGCPSLWL